MALPDKSSKRFYKAALAQASVWGTAVAVGAGDELIVNSDGNPGRKQAYEQADNIGRVMAKDGDLGPNEAIDFAPEFGSKIGLGYSPGAIGSAIAALFGIVATPAAEGDGYKHVFDWADEMAAFFTFVTMRNGVIWEIPSCVCYKLSLKMGNGKLQGSIGLRGNFLKNDSVINTETEIDALTPEAEANFIKVQHGVLRMNDEGDTALDSGDILETADLQLDLERTVDAQISLGGNFISRPKESVFKHTAKLTLPYATAANVALFDKFVAKTAQKMDIVFSGPLLGGTTHYALSLGFPRMKFTAPPDVKLEDIMKNGLELLAEEAAAAPAGMTGHVRPYLELVNLRPTEYLS